LPFATEQRDPELQPRGSATDHLPTIWLVKMFDRFVSRRLRLRRGNEMRLTGGARELYFSQCAGSVIGALDSGPATVQPCLE